MPSFHSTLTAAAALLFFAAPLLAYPAAHHPTFPDALEFLKGARPRDGGSSNCNNLKMDLPSVDGPKQLSGPGSKDLKLVVIGHGTQKYTCADSTSKSVPAGNGAVADLYDISCITRLISDDKLSKLPQLILHHSSGFEKFNLQKIGTHYFYPDNTTPVFKIKGKKEGLFVGQKLENVPAPSYADAGLPPDAFGAVDWLKLGSKEGVYTADGDDFKSKGYKLVYRVETAGGKAPPTCQDRPAQFTIPYAAQYMFYN